MTIKHPLLLVAALLVAMAAPATAQTEEITITTLPTLAGTEGDQWHVTYAPAQRIKSLTFTDTATPPGALSTTRIRPIRFLALDSGTATDRDAETICLDADAYTYPDTLTSGTDGGDDSFTGTAVANHDCQNEITLPASSEPAVVACTTANYSLDCSSQATLPDSVRVSIVSIDDNCRTAAHGVIATATFADDTTATGRWTLMDDDLFPC